MRESKEALSSRSIADRLGNYRETRRYLNSATSISNLILGADGITKSHHYPEHYTMTDWEAFRRWVGLTDDKWRSIENLTEHFTRTGDARKDYRRIVKKDYKRRRKNSNG